MKNTLKTMILGFLVLTLALGFTSCGDESGDPAPNKQSNEVTFNDVTGVWNFVSLTYQGTTFTDSCDPKWNDLRNDFNKPISGMRTINKLSLDITNTLLENYSCVNNKSNLNIKTFNSNSLEQNIISLDNSLQFEIISFKKSEIELKLIRWSQATPNGGVYKLKKAS